MLILSKHCTSLCQKSATVQVACDSSKMERRAVLHVHQTHVC